LGLNLDYLTVSVLKLIIIKKKHLLFSVPLAISSGASTINQNIGKLESSGFELTLNSN
jgi:hypothetical protein